MAKLQDEINSKPYTGIESFLVKLYYSLDDGTDEEMKSQWAELAAFQSPHIWKYVEMAYFNSLAHHIELKFNKINDLDLAIPIAFGFYMWLHMSQSVALLRVDWNKFERITGPSNYFAETLVINLILMCLKDCRGFVDLNSDEDTSLRNKISKSFNESLQMFLVDVERLKGFSDQAEVCKKLYQDWFQRLRSIMNQFNLSFEK